MDVNLKWVSDAEKQIQSFVNRCSNAEQKMEALKIAMKEARNAYQELFLFPEGKDNARTYLFVEVVSSLSLNGSFWCRNIASSYDFAVDTVQVIHEQLENALRESELETVHDPTIHGPMFFLSQRREMYMRAKWISTNPEENRYMVLYLDLGEYDEIEKLSNFYCLPSHMQDASNPFLAMHCSLFEEERHMPREAKWCFKDLTANKVLKLKIEKRCLKDDLPFHIVKLVSPIAPYTNINAEVMKYVKEQEEYVTETAKLISNERASIQTSKKITPTSSLKKDSHKQNVHESRTPSKHRSRENSVSLDQAISNHEATSSIKDDEKKSSSPETDLKKILKVDHPQSTKELQQNYMEDIEKQAFSALKAIQTAQNLNHTEGPEPLIPNTVRNVHRILPPLRNLFYNSTTLRYDPWYDIELSNINELYHSQAKVRIFCSHASKERLQSAVYSDGMFEVGINLTRKITQVLDQKYSVYLFIYKFFPDKNYVRKPQRQHRPTSISTTMLGVCKVIGCSKQTMSHVSVTFLSLSKVDNIRSYFDADEIPTNSARHILECIKYALAHKKAIAQFPEIFPWSGVQPVIDNIKKPSKLTSKIKPLLNTSNQAAASKPTLLSPPGSLEECWDDTDEDDTIQGEQTKQENDDSTVETLLTKKTNNMQDPMIESGVIGPRFAKIASSEAKNFQSTSKDAWPNSNDIILADAKDVGDYFKPTESVDAPVKDFILCSDLEVRDNHTKEEDNEIEEKDKRDMPDFVKQLYAQEEELKKKEQRNNTPTKILTYAHNLHKDGNQWGNKVPPICSTDNGIFDEGGTWYPNMEMYEMNNLKYQQFLKEQEKLKEKEKTEKSEIVGGSSLYFDVERENMSRRRSLESLAKVALNEQNLDKRKSISMENLVVESTASSITSSCSDVRSEAAADDHQPDERRRRSSKDRKKKQSKKNKSGKSASKEERIYFKNQEERRGPKDQISKKKSMVRTNSFSNLETERDIAVDQDVFGIPPI